MSMLPFRNRDAAAAELADALHRYRGTHPLVLAIPRGGVPLGRVLADALEGDLDVVLVRKLGAPDNPELAIGAVDEHGHVTLDADARWTGADDAYIAEETARQRAVIAARRQAYAADHAPTPVRGRTVIVVDDGLATGATMRAALHAVREQHPACLVCAVPVAASDSLAAVMPLADDVVCLATPEPFHAVGLYYRDFAPVEDDEVMRLLGARVERAQGSARHVVIPVARGTVEGDLTLPRAPRGLVVFVHGSGSSRTSPRNRAVADALNARGIATLLFDLLTPGEDLAPEARFDIALLAERLATVLEWVADQPALAALPLGLFGASTGAAAAIRVAAHAGTGIAAVVSRGGRPDLAGEDALVALGVPTLLIVGGADQEVLALHRDAIALMGDVASLEVIPRATHLFPEPGALEAVAEDAGDWFLRHFAAYRHAAKPRHRRG